MKSYTDILKELGLLIPDQGKKVKQKKKIPSRHLQKNAYISVHILER